MDRDDLVRVLGEVDRKLSASCDIIIVGGAAMILHFGARRATRDVDSCAATFPSYARPLRLWRSETICRMIG